VACSKVIAYLKINHWFDFSAMLVVHIGCCMPAVKGDLGDVWSAAPKQIGHGQWRSAVNDALPVWVDSAGYWRWLAKLWLCFWVRGLACFFRCYLSSGALYNSGSKPKIRGQEAGDEGTGG